MAINYELERAIEVAKAANNKLGQDLLDNLLTNFKQAQVDGVFADLPREKYTPPKDRSNMQRTESAEMRYLADAKDGPIFTPETVAIIADFFGVTHIWELEHAPQNPGRSWRLEKENNFTLTLSRKEKLNGKPTRKASINIEYYDEWGHIDQNRNGSLMQGVTRIAIQPTYLVPDGSVIFVHESKYISIHFAVRKDGVASFITFDRSKKINSD